MLRLFFALLYNLVALVLLPLSLLRRRLAVRSKSWLSLELSAPFHEFGRRRFWKSRPDLQSLRQALKTSEKDPRVEGLTLSLKSFAQGTASAAVLHDVLRRYRAGGKKVVVYLPDGGTTREYLIASAADTVLLGRHAPLSALGFSIHTPYLKRGLDRLGVAPEVFARGEYKTAGEPLTRGSMSEAQREQLDAVLDEAFQRTVEAIAEGRRQSRRKVEHWMDDGPWAPRRALAEGLVDELAHEDEVESVLARAGEFSRVVPVRRYLRHTKRRWVPLTRPGYLAVVNVHGVIVGEGPASGRVADEASFIKSVTKVREDPRALGLLLHIDSRGGSALASARMFHEVKRCASDKPVVAYFNDVAASGGYMIGVGAHEIVAQPLTLTGSIGVVAARIVLAPLFERLGIDWTTLKRGARADMLSPLHAMDDGAKAAFTAELEEFYASFVEAVAEGRKKTVDAVEALARGRVWTGRAAVVNGLVDAEGDFDGALARLRERIGPRASGARARLVSVSVPPKLPPLVSSAAEVANVLLADYGRELAHLFQDPRQDRFWAWSPVFWGGRAAG